MSQRQNQPILCIGITPCLQRTLFFRRLLPGEVNRATNVVESASGKGVNVARVVRTLGGNSRLIGIRGGDTGKRFEALLNKDEVPHYLIASASPTRICQTLIDETSGEVTELVEEAAPLSADEIEILLQTVTNSLTEPCHLIISGSPPPKTSATLYSDLIQLANSTNARVLLDTQKDPLLGSLSARPWLVKLNCHELAATLGRTIHTPIETRNAATVLLERGAENVVITDGPNAVWWFSRERARSFRPPCVQPVNPIGSGDAMAAGIAVGSDRGDTLEESLRLGIACGAANALTLTSGVIQADSVRELLAMTKFATSLSVDAATPSGDAGPA